MGLAIDRQGIGYGAVSLTLLLVLELSLLSVAGFAFEAPPRLKIVCSTSLFRGVSRAELLSTSSVWTQNIGRHTGAPVDGEVVLAGSLEELQRDVEQGAGDLLVSSSLEYLAINPTGLQPALTMTASDADRGKIKYLLLINRDSNVSQLAELKGKTVNSYARSDSNLNHIWLSVLTETSHLGPADQFFAHVTPMPKPSSSCLPVFFGKADACLIDDPSWATLRELNPQIANKLKIIAESKPMIENLVSIRPAKLREHAEILSGMLGLQDSAEGREVLMFFKCRQALRIEVQDLAEVEELRSSFLRLTPPGERRLLLPALLHMPVRPR